jgi:hypothetical protein
MTPLSILLLFAGCSDTPADDDASTGAASPTPGDDDASSSGDDDASATSGDDDASGSAGDDDASSSGDDDASGTSGDDDASSSAGDDDATGATGDDDASRSSGDDDATGAATPTPTPAPVWDADGDGFDAQAYGGLDCDDSDPEVNPDQLELCDSVDNDCDGATDDDAIDADPFYADRDDDGYGDTDEMLMACTAPEGYVPDDTDCDDSSALRYPGNPEACDGIDNNCDGRVDDGVTRTWFPDVDGDGYGGTGESIQACEAPDGYAASSSDCDDADPDNHPDNAEQCDGADNDCSGLADDHDAPCPCPVGFYDGHPYQFCAKPSAWTDARAFCRAYGYHLATIDDHDEDTWQRTTSLAQVSSSTWWLGMNDLFKEGAFAWEDGSPADYAIWDVNQPDDYGGAEDCVQNNYAGGSGWNDGPCSYKHNFICEASLEAVTTGAPAGAGDPSGYYFAPQYNRHVIYRSADNHLHDLEWNGAWDHHDLTAYTGAPVAAGDACSYGDPDSSSAIYRGANGHVLQLFWYGKWQWGDLTTLTSAPVTAGKPSCISDGFDHVFYRTADGHLHDLRWNGSYWTHTDVTTKSGAPAAVGDLSSYYTSGATPVPHAAYRAADGRILVVYYFNGAWEYSDASGQAKAPAAVGEPAGFADAYDRLVYRSADSHVHLLQWTGTVWGHLDLTDATGAPLASSDPTGYMTDDASSGIADYAHVLYRSQEGDIHELYSNSPGVWGHTDLSEYTGAPAAAGTPSGYDTPDGQHVLYRATDGAIREMTRSDTWYDHPVSSVALTHPDG